MRFEFVKNGMLQGWVVATAFSLITIVLLILGFIFECVADGWVKFGERYETIYISSLVIWLGYKGIKAVTDKIQSTREKIAEIQKGENHGTVTP